MQTMKRTLLMCLALLAAPTSFAQQPDVWPSRPVTMIVPASAGSGTDILARELARRLGQALGQNVIVDNKTGGIAISGTAHVPRTASIATMGEQGYPFESVGWFGVFAPPGTPAAIVQRLTAEINKIQKLPESAEKMTTLNFEPPPVKTAEQFGAIVASDLQTWKKLIMDAGITPED